MSSPSSEPEPSESTSSNSMSSSRSPANNNIHIEIKSTTTIEKLPPTKSTVSLILTDSGNSPDVMKMCQNRWIVFPTYLINDIYEMLMFILLTVRLQITRFVGRVLKNHISFRVLTKKWSVYYQMAVFIWLMKSPDSHEDQWGQCRTGLSTPARGRISLKHQKQTANWLKASHSHESDVCKASTFFLSLPLMWQSLFTPSKHIASRRPLPSILVTLRTQRFCKESKLQVSEELACYYF